MASSTKGLLYYSDCRGDVRILETARRQLLRAAPGLPLVSVTLAPLDFGHNCVLYECARCHRWVGIDAAKLNYYRCKLCRHCANTADSFAAMMTPATRGQLTMFRQVMVGLEALETDLVFFCEHDVLYHPSHFVFDPPSPDRFWYNQHRYQVSAIDGRAVHYRCCQTANLCADRRLLLEHYRRRIAVVEREGYHRQMGYEPGTNRWARSLDGVDHETWMAPYPNLDIRTRYNLSKTRWSVDEFRNKRSCEGWKEVTHIPGWGRTAGRFEEWLVGLD